MREQRYVFFLSLPPFLEDRRMRAVSRCTINQGNEKEGNRAHATLSLQCGILLVIHGRGSGKQKSCNGWIQRSNAGDAERESGTETALETWDSTQSMRDAALNWTSRASSRIKRNENFEYTTVDLVELTHLSSYQRGQKWYKWNRPHKEKKG